MGCNNDEPLKIADLSFKGEIPDRVPEPLDDFEESACPDILKNMADVYCGFLTVPEDYSKPDGKTIRLAVARLISDGSDVQDDPIVYLEGGPGGSALETLSYLYDTFSEFAQNRDVILFDQRGTGFSEPDMSCAFDDIQDEFFDTDVDALLTQCRDELVGDGVGLKFYNSQTNAHDVDSLRKALGYKKWNLWGISYGTRLALTVLRDYPGEVRSAIIDSTVPLEVNLFESLGANAQNAFELLFNECEIETECNSYYPDLMNHLLEALDKLDASPKILNLSDGTPFDLTGTIVMNVLFQIMYSAEDLIYMPMLVNEIYNEDYENVLSIIEQISMQGSGVSTGMYLSVNCAEEYAYIDQDNFDTITENLYQRFVTDFGIDEYESPCEIWNVPPAPKKENSPVVSDLPVLVMSGYFDPITPPAWGEMIHKNLKNSQFFIFNNGSHGTSISICGTKMALNFLDSPTDDATIPCYSNLALDNFYTALKTDRPSKIKFAKPETEIDKISLKKISGFKRF
ncbi:MAG: alpha/beta fold hydrolase [Deltaproteobacteria bacterium]|nr:alpha/beta fold hydrolase [Deltaproteobacteria bacterium]